MRASHTNLEKTIRKSLAAVQSTSKGYNIQAEHQSEQQSRESFNGLVSPAFIILHDRRDSYHHLYETVQADPKLHI